MHLPEFLSTDDAGFIHAKGHRIGLHHVLRLYNEGYSPEMIAAQYPSLPLALVHKIIAFYLENGAAVDAYIAEHDREIQNQIAGARPAPPIADLRSRLESRRSHIPAER